LPDSRKEDLCNYRLDQAKETLQVAKECLENKHYKDSINRSYYAAFYAIKAVLALYGIDFKRHKDVVAYFNKNFVADGRFDREIGRGLGRLKQIREKSDYGNFHIASFEEAEQQVIVAETVIQSIVKFIPTIDE
jgi:uncharacterized protein (UPF0332 family)